MPNLQFQVMLRLFGNLQIYTPLSLMLTTILRQSMSSIGTMANLSDFSTCRICSTGSLFTERSKQSTTATVTKSSSKKKQTWPNYCILVRELNKWIVSFYHSGVLFGIYNVASDFKSIERRESILKWSLSKKNRQALKFSLC